MFDNIWKEIIETGQIQEGERIYISLDGYLEKIPVELIMGYDFKYVSDKYDIIRVSSTSEISKLRNPQIGSNAVLYGGLKYNSDPRTIIKNNIAIYGRTRSINENLFKELPDSLFSELRSTTKYLPWTKVEVDTASCYLKKLRYKDVIVLDDDYGTEESFKALSGNSPSILHLATHGYIRQSTVPVNSLRELYGYFMENTSLLFSGVLTTASINKDTLLVEDGILRSSEISVLNLSNTQLLVLSACNSGLGGASPVGNLGLVRAFKAAGVGTILMTLGYVDDSACFYMMKFFYESLSSGYSKRESFKMAQRKLRAMEEYEEFSYWGIFVMID
jgi:CHAT domain-containing protein